MTKLRFFINLVFVYALFIVAVLVTGNSILIYTDIASFVLGILLPIIVISFIFLPSEQARMIKEIFTASGTGDKAVLKKTLCYLKSFKKILLISTILWTIVGAIGIGVHIESPEALGVNFGVLMIVPLYVALFLLSVVEPLRASAEKNLLG